MTSELQNFLFPIFVAALISFSNAAEPIPYGENMNGDVGVFGNQPGPLEQTVCGSALDKTKVDYAFFSNDYWCSESAGYLCNNTCVTVTYNEKVLKLPVWDRCEYCPTTEMHVSESAYGKLEANWAEAKLHNATWQFVTCDGSAPQQTCTAVGDVGSAIGDVGSAVGDVGSAVGDVGSAVGGSGDGANDDGENDSDEDCSDEEGTSNDEDGSDEEGKKKHKNGHGYGHQKDKKKFGKAAKAAGGAGTP